LPDAPLLENARLVSASIFGPGMNEMLALARSHNKPLAVADIAGPDDPRLMGAVLVTTSRTVLHQRHQVTDIEAWIAAVHAASGAVVVVSDGLRLAVARSADGRWVTAEPPPIIPVDTTGAGDALKAGMMLGWLRGWPIEQTLRWSIAAASLACLQYGACEQPASIPEVEHLMPQVHIHQEGVQIRKRGG
jgi:sugar/nucleoside kinase (ribokinase family)